MRRSARAWVKTNDVPFQPMSAREREDLEERAGRAFLSEDRAAEYRRRKLRAGINPAAAVAETAYVQAPLEWYVVRTTKRKHGRAA